MRERAPASRSSPLVLLSTLYAVPTVALSFEDEFVRGALLALLVIAYLRLERLRRRDGSGRRRRRRDRDGPALIAAPVLDREEPWFDYERWALKHAPPEVDDVLLGPHLRHARLAARRARGAARQGAASRAYWKAPTSTSSTASVASSDRGRGPRRRRASRRRPARRRWNQEITVTVRNLRTDSSSPRAPRRASTRPTAPRRDRRRRASQASARRCGAATSYKVARLHAAPLERELRAASARLRPRSSSELPVHHAGAGTGRRPAGTPPGEPGRRSSSSRLRTTATRARRLPAEGFDTSRRSSTTPSA